MYSDSSLAGDHIIRKVDDDDYLYILRSKKFEIRCAQMFNQFKLHIKMNLKALFVS